ncbi:MAG TPA: hypothetical protein PLV06_07705 [Bacteroidales bacterium]|nr:hypothetical protein [Bacteroidales bacterium]HPI69111.1 hypothetical protein [Bacteroidales bacterium]HPR12251.1 hypothetical protein [Bacteroidales bacterium]HRW83899.1 hypothetical protein [Bacteroidales bacterium]
MDKIIGTLGIILIVILPLIRFYQRSNWTKTQILIGIIGLTILWFLIATPLHELSHMIGAKISGVKITDYQLLPKYWAGDFRTAYIKPEYDTRFQEFVVRTSPYFRDLIIAIIGYVVLIRKRIINPFIVGFIFVFFLLNSVFDIVVNFLGYSIDKDGDLNGLSKLIGHLWTYFIGIFIIGLTSVLTYRIFKNYKGFPREVIKT